MDKRDELIKKLEELILHFKLYSIIPLPDELKKSLAMQVEIASLKDEIEKEKEPRSYGSCKHPKKYHFKDRDGNLRCSDCHKVIE